VKNGSISRWQALALAAVLTVAGCSSAGDVSQASNSTPALNATNVALLPTTTPGLPTFDEEQFQQLLGQLRGTPVIVNIWASWCGPCRDEAPLLAQTARTYGQRVQFLGIDILDTKDAATAFVREFQIPYPSVFDPSGRIRDALGFLGQPDTIFYGPDGSKMATVSGVLSQHVLSTNIGRLLAMSTTSTSGHARRRGETASLAAGLGS
jgi:cytochrome c biogenesis protein CcmG/thiol:disulfide interchange protein DsbE